MNFCKMHGLGNDFILINGLTENIAEDYNQLALKICHRNFGVGADGLMIVLPSDKADIKMRIFNSDGSEAEMCGNGIRCFAKYIYEEKIVFKNKMSVETKAGIMLPELTVNAEDKVESVRVDMGKPQLERSKIPMKGKEGQVIEELLEVGGEKFKITAVSMGNPHCVIFVEDIDEFELVEWGPIIENHPLFPEKTNVEFAQMVNKEEIIMKVWERGSGITLACGTGACATLVAGVLTNRTRKKATIKLPGGDLFIEWEDNGHIYMTGPAQKVFRGIYPI